MDRPPTTSTRGPRAVVATADQLATQAALTVLTLGGNAVDAAIAANATLAVTAPHLCGLGGDLFALVHTGRSVVGLNASGRAGSGVDASKLRDDGHDRVPFRHDPTAVTVPGCVDGWTTLHTRFGHLPLTTVLAPAVRYAEQGFPASPLLVHALAVLDPMGSAALVELGSQATRTGARVRRPGVARTLLAVADGGRAAFYQGEFGRGLMEVGRSTFTSEDLTTVQADWVDPLTARAFDVDLHTIGPNSQGYLTLGAAALADAYGLPDDPVDPMWAHLLIEAATAAGHDRPAVLHEHADGPALLTSIRTRIEHIDPTRAGQRQVPHASGDTTYLCVVDTDGMAVSLIQSNASGFGSWLVEPATGINLHNRGIGFSLVPGHPAELTPRRRPPHTLSPALATQGHDLVAVFGTMGGDAQPQILLQLAARMFGAGHSPARAIDAPRWVLAGPDSGFDTWTSPDGPDVVLEGHAPSSWERELATLGHRVRRVPTYGSEFGHAHAIVVDVDGMLAGACDPRARVGSVAAM